MVEHVIISRAEAKRAGLKWYFTGVPCLYGHVCERLTSNWGCKECGIIKIGAWREANPELLRANHAKWHSTNTDKAHAANRAWLKANPEAKRLHNKKYREANPETRRQTLQNWRHANPDANAAIRHTRRAHKRAAQGNYTSVDIARLLVEQYNKCLCKKSFDVVPYTVDHVVPLSRGGSNWPANLQLLCSFCNGSKGAKLMSEWVVPVRRAA